MACWTIKNSVITVVLVSCIKCINVQLGYHRKQSTCNCRMALSTHVYKHSIGHCVLAEHHIITPNDLNTDTSSSIDTSSDHVLM